MIIFWMHSWSALAVELKVPGGHKGTHNLCMYKLFVQNMPTNCDRNMNLHTNGDQRACQKFIRTDKQGTRTFWVQPKHTTTECVSASVPQLQSCLSFREWFGTWSDSVSSCTPEDAEQQQPPKTTTGHHHRGNGQMWPANARSLREILSFIYMMINAVHSPRTWNGWLVPVVFFLHVLLEIEWPGDNIILGSSPIIIILMWCSNLTNDNNCSMCPPGLFFQRANKL